MDPFDEFEFKPLTNGLGFHKKSAALKEQLKKSGVVESEISGLPSSLPKSLLDDKVPAGKTSFDEVIANLEKATLKLKKQPIHDLEITETLPRHGKVSAMEIETPRPVQSPFPKPEVYRQPFIPANPTPASVIRPAAVKQQPAVGTRRGAADSPVSPLMAASTSIPSAILDLIVVVALSLVFIVALMLVTGVDMAIVVANIQGDKLTQASLVALFVAVMQMYVIISRSFYGRTLGEWTFDVQLGRENDQAVETYPLRVLLRALIVTVSGLVVLPILSLMTGEDLAGRLTGTQLYRLRM